MLSSHDTDEHVAATLQFDSDWSRPGVGRLPDGRTRALQDPAGTFSVSLLPAPEPDQEVAVVSAHGEIDLTTAPLLREILVPVLERDRGPVVVDLSEVQFMDSTGVHVLLDTLKRLEPQNRRLAIACREASQVYRLLGFVGLLDKVAVHRSREGAVIGVDEYPDPNLVV